MVLGMWIELGSNKGKRQKGRHRSYKLQDKGARQVRISVSVHVRGCETNVQTYRQT